MKLWTWLRMFAPGDVPTSEERYNEHLDLIDISMPTNGGMLQADGSWLQETWKINPPWPQSVPGLAATSGQLYIPTVGCDRDGITTVLDDPTIQDVAAQNLIDLALSGRFDSPWDGVYLDLEGIPSSHKDKLSAFLLLLSYRIHKEGLLCVVSVRGKVSDPGPDYDGAYNYDFSVVAQAADFCDLRMYGYWKPISQLIDRSMCPYWWAKECIEYALEQGIPAERLLFGVGSYSSHYPNSSAAEGRSDVTYANAMQLMVDADAKAEWIERNKYGLVRERLVDLGAGHIWVHDGDTIRHNLDLVDEYGLSGIALFVPGMGDVYHWQVLEEWRNQE